MRHETRLQEDIRCLRAVAWLSGAALLALAGNAWCANDLDTPAARSSVNKDGSDTFNTEWLGHDDLQGRSAYQPVIRENRGRWIAYVGHHGGAALNPLTGVVENSGTSIIDVTDPRKPRYLAHLPGEKGQAESGGAQMVRVCNGAELPKGDKSKVYMLRNFGNQAHEMWDVTMPEKPVRLAVLIDKLKDTHKSWWECDSGIAYLVSGLGEWRTRRMTQVFDLSDPVQPRFIRNFGLVGQQPGATGAVPTELHGMISSGPQGNRVHFAYGTNKGGVMQIVDREKLLKGPAAPTNANLLYPQVGKLELSPKTGAHTTFPILGLAVPDFAMPVRNLSGGNQQRLVARREMRIASRLLIAAYPSRGLDVGAINTMMRYFVELRDAGVGVILISEELEELLNLSDRIAVMFHGEIMGIVETASTDIEAIGMLMGGQRAPTRSLEPAGI